MTDDNKNARTGLIDRLRRRGVVRVVVSYVVISWLLLQIADVVLEPLGAPAWAMRALLAALALGLPIAAVLAWFYEITPSGIERDNQREEEVRPVARGWRRYADLVVIGILVVVIAVLLVRQEGGEPLPEEGPPVVAVLPFHEIGAQESVFGMGLADTLIHKLGQLSGLVVLASRSTFEFSGPEVNMAEAGAKLGATVLVEGTVQRGAGALRINARLVTVHSGRQLWSGSYERREMDLFAVQDEIANAVSQALHVVLSPGEAQRLEQPVASDLSAWDAYTLGQISLAKRGYHVGDAIGYFRQAIQLDPDFALAHAALAESLYMAPSYLREDMTWDDVATEARKAAAAAQALDPDLSEAYMAQFYVYQAENLYSGEQVWPEAQLEALLNRALSRNPSNAAAARYIAGYAKDPLEKIRLLERAALLDPRSGIIGYDIAMTLVEIEKYDQARDWLLKAGQTTDPFFMIGYANVGIVYAFYAGRLDEATRWARLFALAFPGTEFESIHVDALWGIGLRTEAEQVLDSLEASWSDETANRNSKWLLGNRFIFSWFDGDWETAAGHFARLQTEVLENFPEWPDLTRLPGADWFMALTALSEIREGRNREALAGYETSLPSPLDYSAYFNSAIFIHPALMTAALYKLNGRAAEARDLVEQFLAKTAAAPVSGISGVGFARFMAHAMLGDVEAARKAFREVLDSGHMALFEQLDKVSFDADYRFVMSDPEISSMHAELLERVNGQAEAFTARPDLLPEDVPPWLKSAWEKASSR